MIPKTFCWFGKLKSCVLSRKSIYLRKRDDNKETKERTKGREEKGRQRKKMTGN